ncbi:PA2169 family four-helix-bundle protein [Chondromyces apiculatus]|nr:PA2169 family four-helix-bundle protein [Chondromyces apiculatus]
MSQEIISTLNDLVETLKDGEKGFTVAAEDTKDASLKSVFTTLAQERAASARQLQSVVASLGGEPEKSGSTAGAVHRGWINLKSAVTGRDDTAILNECERGEDFAKAAFKKAMEKSLPAEMQTVIQQAAQSVQKGHDQVKALRDQHKAAST